MHGTVFGGQQPVNQSNIYVLTIGTGGYGSVDQVLKNVQTDGSGNFSIPARAYICPQNNTPMYIIAAGGDAGSGTNNDNLLAATLGTCATAPSQTVNINEITTVAVAYAAGNYLGTQAKLGGPSTTAAGVTTYSLGLSNALLYTAPMLVNMAYGTANTSTANVNLPTAKIITLANVLAACINSNGDTGSTDNTTSCGRLFTAATTSGGSRPFDTFTAAISIAKNPYLNVGTIFNVGSDIPPFAGGLSSAPTDWTLPVAYTVSDNSNYVTDTHNYIIPDLESTPLGRSLHRRRQETWRTTCLATKR